MATENQTQQRILIVEDEDNARKGYEANLRKLNYVVLGVASG
jgi:CheY-like chemotaxis protein